MKKKINGYIEERQREREEVELEVFGLNFGHDGAFFVTTTFDFWRRVD